VSDCVVECAKEFLAALLMPASIRQFFHKSAYGILVSNGELVRVTGHDRTSLFEIVDIKKAARCRAALISRSIFVLWLSFRFALSHGC
jgi:hypothetical protein